MGKSYLRKSKRTAAGFSPGCLVALSVLLIFALSPMQTATAQQTMSVQGIVTDTDGQPLVGALVTVDGVSGAGVVTGGGGKFAIDVRDNATLTVSYLGYKSEKVGVNSRANIEIRLIEDQTEMEAVIVIGYGSARKTDLTGSVTNVKMSDVVDVPVMSIDQALQGRIAGADIMSTTGEPGAGTSIRIRGTRSVTAGNEPLFVVDGVMDGVSDLNEINPGDIESVTVLKDASSTAIYGSRGANGVIIITTKTGRKGSKPIVTFKADVGFSELPRMLDIMNATEFALYRNDYARFATVDNYGDIGPETPLSKYPYPDPYAMGEGTNWVKEITRRAPYQNYTASISGGTGNTSYFGSFGYSDNQGIIKNSGYTRFTGRMNLDHRFNKVVRVGLRLNYTYQNQNANKAEITSASWWQAAIYLSPMIAADSDFNDLWYEGQKFNSPLANLTLRDNFNTRQTTNNSAYIEITPVEGLTLRQQGTLFAYQRHNFAYAPSNMPANVPGVGGTATRSESDEMRLMSETTLSYTKLLNDAHQINALVGWTASRTTTNNLGVGGRGYFVDAVKWNDMGSIPDKETLTPSSSNVKLVKQSFLFRAEYNYKQRYYITATGRMDGASNFAANHKWAFFPSAAVKWNVQNEAFMQDVKWIDELAVRASYGTTGNDAIGAYSSLERMSTSTSGYLFGDKQPVAYYRGRLQMEELTWETTSMYNIGLDISLLNGRIGLTGEVYASKTKDLLLSVQRPSQTGFSSKMTNVGATSNKGWELTLETRNIQRKNFSWTSSLTFSQNKQMVDDIGMESRVETFTSHTSRYMMYGYVAGHPLNALWGFKYGGTWKNQEELERNEVTKAYVSLGTGQRVPGGPRYVDVNNDGVLNDTDLVYMGNADPVLYGGFQNTFRWKGLTVGVYFNYSIGGKIYNISEQFMGNNLQYTNQYRYMLDTWHPERNPLSNIPRTSTLDSVVGDRFIHDASFLRLKNVSVGYTFDLMKVTNNILRDVTVNVSGDNIYLWKNYNGFDPEVSTSSGNSALRRLDAGAYPKPRTIIFSVSLRY